MQPKAQSEFFEPGSAVFAAWHLWNIAADAAQRAKALKRANPGVITADTIAAIVLAAMTTEAFINELGYRLRALTHLAQRGYQNLQHWIDGGKYLESKRIKVRPKYFRIHELLSGEALRPEITPYKEFDILINLRNDLVHPRAQTMPPFYFEYFVNRGWTYNAPKDEPKLVGWIYQLQTPQVACWACRTAYDIVWTVVKRFDNITELAVKLIGESLRMQWAGRQDDERIKWADP